METTAAENKPSTLCSNPRSEPTIGELSESYFRRLRIDGCKSIRTVMFRWDTHLRDSFSSICAGSLDSRMLDSYIEKRYRDGAEPSTINREMAVVRRIYSLASKEWPPRVERIPTFPRLKERNIRTGFATPEQFLRLARAADRIGGVWLRGMIEVGYTYGWRRSELTGLRVGQVDFLTRTIRLDPNNTKNDDGREVKMTRAVERILSRCVAGKSSGDCLVFTRRGMPIGDFRKIWRNLCERAGTPKLLFHDLRRSAARNLRMAGVSENAIMRICGWRTRSVFDRYCIIDSLDAELAMQRLQAWQRKHGLEMKASAPEETSRPGAGGARGTGSLFRRKDSPFWWCQFYLEGRARQVSTKMIEEANARLFLQARIEEIDNGRFVPRAINEKLRARVLELERQLRAAAGRSRELEARGAAAKELSVPKKPARSEIACEKQACASEINQKE